MTLSCVLIVKDEEELLPRCLASLPTWDELVVVDTGSTDRTIEIAHEHGARVEHFDWINDFAAARNYAESLCTMDYVYWQDADEVLVSGANVIRGIVAKGEDVGVKPTMVWERDSSGAVVKSYARQHLLHKRGAYTWKGARHEATVGPDGREEPRIQVEQIERTGGDRAYGDPFEPLRPPADERGLFYLAREHSYAGHHHETIALVDLLLSGPVEWPIQRSDAAILKGNALKALGRHADARAAYLRAVQEWGAWAEPYFALGCLHYEREQWAEGASWFAACIPLSPPAGYFVNDEIYAWRRYDMLAVCLSKVGMRDEARRWGERALGARPGDQRLQDNMKWYAA